MSKYKPNHIAKIMGVGIRVVYNSILNFKRLGEDFFTDQRAF